MLILHALYAHSLVACVGHRHVAIVVDDKLSHRRLPGGVAPPELCLTHRVPRAGELQISDLLVIM